MARERAKIIEFNPQKETTEKQEAPKKFGWKKAVALLGAVVFVGAWTWVFVKQEAQLNEQKREMMYLEDIKNSHEASIREKKEKLNLQDSESFIEEVAREKLNYVKNGEIVFLPIE